MAESPIAPGINVTPEGFPAVPNPGPDLSELMRDLDTRYTQEAASGKLPAAAWEQIQSSGRAHVEASEADAKTFVVEEYAPSITHLQADIVEGGREFEATHPDLDIKTAQSGDVPIADAVRIIEPAAHDAVDIEAQWNSKVLDVKQEYLDLMRDAITIRSQADGADPAQAQADLARVNDLQQQMDAARDAVDARAAQAHEEIDKALPEAERFDQAHPHPGQISETGAPVPEYNVATAESEHAPVVAYIDGDHASADSGHQVDHGAAVAHDSAPDVTPADTSTA